jgi:hypothetical protein
MLRRVQRGGPRPRRSGRPGGLQEPDNERFNDELRVIDKQDDHDLLGRKHDEVRAVSGLAAGVSNGPDVPQAGHGLDAQPVLVLWAGAINLSDGSSTMSPANRCQAHAASDGASLAIDAAPGPYVADEVHEIAPPTPISSGRHVPRLPPTGSAQGVGVVVPEHTVFKGTAFVDVPGAKCSGETQPIRRARGERPIRVRITPPTITPPPRT